jgi:hypothetical protein
MERVEPALKVDEYKIFVHSKEFFFESISELEELLLIDEIVTIPTKLEIENKSKEYFHFNKTLYLKQLKNDLPIENIFYWIYQRLEKRDELNYQNYCEALSLLDEVRLRYSKNRDRVDFDEFLLDIPIVKAEKIKTTER